MQQRIFWLDVARAIAILLVVFTHVKEQIGIEHYLLKSLFYDIDRLGVPIFFMLSGGLVLPKLVNADIIQFYKKRIPQFLFVLAFFSLITTIIQDYLFSNQYNLNSFFDVIEKVFIQHNGLFPANTGSAHQLWFMYTIIQLYLIAPFLAKLVDKLTNKEIIIFISLCLILGQLKQTMGTKFDVSFWDRLGTDFLGSFLAFFLLGYLFLNRNLRLKYSTSTLLFIVPIIISLLREWHKEEFIGTFHWYSSSIFIVISSIGLINLIRIYFENKQVNRWILALSKYSFGIYLWHYLFIYIAKWLMLGYLAKPILYMAYFLFSLFCSLFITVLLSKNRYTKWLAI